MAGYLEDYGVKDERREKMVRRTVLTLLVLILAGGASYFMFRSRAAEKKVNQFLDLLRNKDYQAAYRLWGCTDDSPCKDYTFDKFMEDWGPKSPHPDASAARIKKVGYCGPGVWFKLETVIAHTFGEKGCYCGPGLILTVQFKPGDEVPLRYERKDGTLGFSPWRVCAPELKAFQ